MNFSQCKRNKICFEYNEMLLLLTPHKKILYNTVRKSKGIAPLSLPVFDYPIILPTMIRIIPTSRSDKALITIDSQSMLCKPLSGFFVFNTIKGRDFFPAFLCAYLLFILPIS